MRRFFGLVVLLVSLIYSGCVLVVRPDKDKCSKNHVSTEKCNPCKEKEKKKEQEKKKEECKPCKEKELKNIEA